MTSWKSQQYCLQDVKRVTEWLLALSKFLSNLCLQAGRKCEGLGCLQEGGKIEQKRHPCGKVLSSEKYTYAVGGDKQIQTLLWLQLKAFTEEKTNRNWTWIKNFFRRHCDPYLSYLKCLKHLYAILWTPALQYLPNPWKWRTSREH